MKNPSGSANANYKHGHASGGRSPTYWSWQAMRNRCINSKGPRYHRYGGRGVTVCDSWSRFENFLADMGERPAGMTLERKDNDKGYEPGNCEWATPKAQGRNQVTNRLITYEGKTMCLAEWAERLGVTSDCLWKRLKRRGVSVLSNTTLEAPEELGRTIHI